MKMYMKSRRGKQHASVIPLWSKSVSRLLICDANKSAIDNKKPDRDVA